MGFEFLKKEGDVKFNSGDSIITFILMALFLVMVGNVFLVQEPQLQFFMIFRYLELFLVYLMIVNRVVRQDQVVVCLLAGLCFQALVAFYQYILQGSIGLSFLGEPIANSATLGMAKIDVGSQKILRSFGTFPHANVLGGLLFMGVMYGIALVKKFRWFVAAVVWLLVMGILFSFSRGAFFALIAAFLLYISLQNNKLVIKYFMLALSVMVFFVVALKLESVIFSRLLFDDVGATQERALYLKIGKDMIFDQPLGVGLGAFTLMMQDYTSVKLPPWLFQPVHNIFVLMFNETGILGGVLFIALFVYAFYMLLLLMRKQKSEDNRFAIALLLSMLVGIAVIGMFDHYFVTVYAAQIMLFIYFGFVSSLLSNARLPIKNS